MELHMVINVDKIRKLHWYQTFVSYYASSTENDCCEINQVINNQLISWFQKKIQQIN